MTIAGSHLNRGLVLLVLDAFAQDIRLDDVHRLQVWRQLIFEHEPALLEGDRVGRIALHVVRREDELGVFFDRPKYLTGKVYKFQRRKSKTRISPKINGEIKLNTNLGRGCCQRVIMPRLLLLRSEFNFRWSLQFLLWNFCLIRQKINNKRDRGLPI